MIVIRCLLCHGLLAVDDWLLSALVAGPGPVPVCQRDGCLDWGPLADRLLGPHWGLARPLLFMEGME